MELINNTLFQADYGTGFARDGRRVLFVIVKATYRIIPGQHQLHIHEQQLPLVTADIPTGEPGYSATLYETDFSTYKPHCDIVLNGSAWVPGGKSAPWVDVLMQVKNHIKKTFRVKGNRNWLAPQPVRFSNMPISYDNAFGGVDGFRPERLRYYEANPVGRGYSWHKKEMANLPLPNTEETNHPVTRPDGKYRPMAFGSVGRAWPLRAHYAGTYDEKWVANTMPFYPDDFDFRYFQCAPPEQQMPYIQGGEEVGLVNLSRHGTLIFHLPGQIIPVTVIPLKGQPSQVASHVDTVTVEPEFERVTMVSRAVIPLKNSLFDLREVVVGEVERQWIHQQRTPGKLFYPNFADYLSKRNK